MLPICTVVAVGEMLIDPPPPPVLGGVSVTLADAVFVASAEDFAVTVTTCPVVIDEGAVYRPPADIVPTAGLRDQVTAVLELPVTVAVS